jgi:hypothetical protein
MSNVVDLYLAYKFLRNLVSPFERWEAFKQGVIDKDGNILVDKKNRNTMQRYSLGYFDVISLNLKKLLSKVPGGKSAIASYAAALLLLREPKPLKEDYSEEIDLDQLQEKLDLCIEEVQAMFLGEEAPVNAVGGGNVAGLGVGENGEPPVSQKSSYRKKNIDDTKKIETRNRRLISFAEMGKEIKPDNSDMGRL